MSQDLEELLVWTFHGDRFQAPGIDLRDLQALVELRRALVSFAREVWKARNPDRKNMVRHAETSLDLRILQFQPGSCRIAVMYRPPEPTSTQRSLFPVKVLDLDARDRSALANSLPEAARNLAFALKAVAANDTIPHGVSDECLADVKRLIDSVADGARFEVHVPPNLLPKPLEHIVTGAGSWASTEGPELGSRPPGTSSTPPETTAQAARSGDRQPVVVTVDPTEVVRSKPAEPSKYTRLCTVTGDVSMAALDGKAIVHVEGSEIRVSFATEYEELITRALHEHKDLRVRLRGDGTFDSASGKLLVLTVRDAVILSRVEPPVLSREALEELAHSQDGQSTLYNYVFNATLKPTLLTFAAEYAGACISSQEIVGPLLDLLCHESQLVREGAIYGLAHHQHPLIRSILTAVYLHDPSPGVREAALAILEATLDDSTARA